MISQVRPLLVLFVLLSAITGLAYPLVITSVSRVAFPDASRGSVVEIQGRPTGSRLIGQSFADPGHFWARPSATNPQPYNGLSSGGSNLGPLNPALVEAVRARILALRAADPGNAELVPTDLVTASASGLDPHISPAAARYQVARVARARGKAREAISALVERHVEERQWGLFGEPRVNVLELNLALDAAR